MKQIRHHEGFSQKELAEKLNTSFRTIQSYEIGKSIPGGKVLRELAKRKFNINWLLTGEGNMKQDGYKFEDAYSPTMLDVGLFENVISNTDNQISEWGIGVPDEIRETLILEAYRLSLTSGSETQIELGKIFSELLAKLDKQRNKV
jgi:transcriptional regulator with XRE-family HTH domain